jgi:hypothetical protein
MSDLDAISAERDRISSKSVGDGIGGQCLSIGEDEIVHFVSSEPVHLHPDLRTL